MYTQTGSFDFVVADFGVQTFMNKQSSVSLALPFEAVPRHIG